MSALGRWRSSSTSRRRSLAWVAARAITAPFRTLGRAADRIASGDLTASPPSVSRDEIGQLAADFRRMAQGLKALVGDVQGASERVSLGAREAGAIGERVRAGAVDEHAGVVAVQGAVEAMEGSVLLVSRGVGGLSEYVVGDEPRDGRDGARVRGGDEEGRRARAGDGGGDRATWTSSARRAATPQARLGAPGGARRARRATRSRR